MNYSMLRKTPSRYALEIEHIYQLLGTAAWWCDGLSTQKWIEIAGVQAISAALVILHWHWISQTSDAEMCVLLKYKIRIVVEDSYYLHWYFDKKSCFVGFFFQEWNEWKKSTFQQMELTTSFSLGLKQLRFQYS